MMATYLKILLFGNDARTVKRAVKALEEYAIPYVTADPNGTVSKDILTASDPPNVVLIVGLDGTRLQGVLHHVAEGYRRAGIADPAIVCLIKDGLPHFLAADHRRMEFDFLDTLNYPGQLQRVLQVALTRLERRADEPSA